MAPSEQEIQRRRDQGREIVRFFELCLASAPFLEFTPNHERRRRQAWARRTVTPEALEAGADWAIDAMGGVEAYVPTRHPMRFREEIAAVVDLPSSAGLDLALFPVQPSFAVVHGDALQAVWLLHGAQERFEARLLSEALARRLDGRPRPRLRVPGTRHRDDAEPARLVLAHEAPYGIGEVRVALNRPVAPEQRSHTAQSRAPSPGVPVGLGRGMVNVTTRSKSGTVTVHKVPGPVAEVSRAIDAAEGKHVFFGEFRDAQMITVSEVLSVEKAPPRKARMATKADLLAMALARKQSGNGKPLLTESVGRNAAVALRSCRAHEAA